MIRFGTGGWRAVIGDEFTKANLQILAEALSDKIHDENKADKEIVIGYDRRFLSKEAMKWMAEVFAKRGIRVDLINKSVPTPLVMYYVKMHGLEYGFMITASHNPAIYNGVKVFTYGGRDADEKQTEDIERYLDHVEKSCKNKEGITDIQTIEYEEALSKGMVREIYPLNEYVDSIIGAIDMNAIKESGLRIVLDPMYGVSETAIKQILITGRCEVETINGRHDTLFGGHLPAPNEETLRDLETYVKIHGYDLGIATDGDADRLGVIDDKGRFLHPNDILVVLYYYLIKYKGMKGPAVRSICTTHLIDKVAESFGEKAYEVPVGFKWVSAKMDETNALIGGESSGGLSVNGHISGKDGVYGAALLVEMLAVTGKKMSQIMDEIWEEYGKTAFVPDDFRFHPDDKDRIYNLIMVDKYLPELPWRIKEVSYIDGLLVKLENGGWISVRFSGTEPLLRIFTEMPTEQEARNAAEIFKEFVGV
jgi:phosphomannomutase